MRRAIVRGMVLLLLVGSLSGAAALTAGCEGRSLPSGAVTTAVSVPSRLTDGAWELRVDRIASLANVRLPSDELSEKDYHALTEIPDPLIFVITVSENGERVSIKGQGHMSEFRAVGTRTSVDTARITYDLGPAPGGRLVIWFTYKPDIQAELTQYGSGVPMIFSDRGEMVHAQPENSTSTTGRSVSHFHSPGPDATMVALVSASTVEITFGFGQIVLRPSSSPRPQGASVSGSDGLT